jgi:5-methylcytosine-specific restriction endonuclease McrA
VQADGWLRRKVQCLAPERIKRLWGQCASGSPKESGQGVKEYNERNKLVKQLGFKGYRDYLDSETWQTIRGRVLERDQEACHVCGKKASQVHHRRYDIETLTGRSLDYLVSLCGCCHYRSEFKGKKKRTLYSVNASIEGMRTGQKKKTNQEREAEENEIQSEVEFLTGPSSPLRSVVGSELLSESELRSWAIGFVRKCRRQAAGG